MAQYFFTTRYRVGMGISFSCQLSEKEVMRYDDYMVGSLRFWYIYAPTQNIWNQILKSLGLRQHDRNCLCGTIDNGEGIGNAQFLHNFPFRSTLQSHDIQIALASRSQSSGAVQLPLQGQII